MDVELDVFKMVQLVLGGLGIFLLGMKLLSDGMQALAGNKLNRLIGAVTDNRFLAILVGVGVTALVQSSSATTVMVIGFVNSGLMTLMQAIGVIFGANVGTTISLWVLTLNVAKFGPMIIGISAFVYLFAKRDRTHFIGMAVLGLGMLFFGLQLMSDGFKPLGATDSLNHSLALFSAVTMGGFLKSVLIGALITGVIQSSAAVLGIVMGLAMNGVIGFDTAIAIIMGSNIGTTITAGLACIGASRNAIRAALAHTLFNVIGVFFVILFHTQFVALSESLIRLVTANPTGPLNMKIAIVGVHTGFNVSCVLILFPFMRLFAKIVTFLVPVRVEEAKSERYKPKYLDKRLLGRAPIAIAQAEKELLVMGDTCLEMLADLHKILGNERNTAIEDGIFRGEENMDVAQKEIAEYVSALLHDNVTHAIANSARRVIRQADEFESVSDHIRNALKAYLKIRNANETLTDLAIAEVLDLCEKVSVYCREIMDIIKEGRKERVVQATQHNKAIDDLAKQYRDCHLQRLMVSCKEPVKSLVYSDMLIAFRRVNDHLLNVAEALEV